MSYVVVFVVFFLAMPGTLYTIGGFMLGDGPNFVGRHPRTSLVLFVLWCAVFGAPAYHWAKTWADTSEASSQALAMQQQVEAEHRTWPPYDVEMLTFVDRCTRAIPGEKISEGTCIERILPFVEHAFAAQEFREMIARDPTSQDLPPEVAAIVRDRIRAQGDAVAAF